MSVVEDEVGCEEALATQAVPPRPWSVYIEDGECWGIKDANGERVVETDTGVYPPNLRTALLIVKAVNDYEDSF